MAHGFNDQEFQLRDGEAPLRAANVRRVVALVLVTP